MVKLENMVPGVGNKPHREVELMAGLEPVTAPLLRNFVPKIRVTSRCSYG